MAIAISILFRWRENSLKKYHSGTVCCGFSAAPGRDPYVCGAFQWCPFRSCV